jgi:hypothetical protein
VASDDLDKRAWLRSQPGHGPAWAEAIEFGVDVALLELNLAMTPDERFQQSLQMTKFLLELDEAGKALRDPAK